MWRRDTNPSRDARAGGDTALGHPRHGARHGAARCPGRIPARGAPAPCPGTSHGDLGHRATSWARQGGHAVAGHLWAPGARRPGHCAVGTWVKSALRGPVLGTCGHAGLGLRPRWAHMGFWGAGAGPGVGLRRGTTVGAVGVPPVPWGRRALRAYSGDLWGSCGLRAHRCASWALWA